MIIAFSALAAALVWKAHGLGETWAVGVLWAVGYIVVLFALGAVINGVHGHAVPGPRRRGR